MSNLTSFSTAPIVIPESLRHIKIFTTPAGTPSLTGKDTRPSNWFRWFPSTVQHWGVFVESQHDGHTGGTFFELAFPGGSLGVMTRSRSQREAEEGKNARWLNWEDTYHLTEWTDEQIETTANKLCRDELQRDYDVRNRNCQSFTNLLIQIIAYGSEEYIPRYTASHAFGGGGPSNKHFIVLHPVDQAQPSSFKGTNEFQIPDWNAIGQRHAHILQGTKTINMPIGATAYIDMNDANRLEGPSTVHTKREIALAYARGKSGASRPDWVAPPPFSIGIPDETRKAMNAQHLFQNREQRPDGNAFETPPERHIGPRTASVQNIADKIEESFNSQIRATRSRQEREAEFKQWDEAKQTPEPMKRLKWEELSRLESSLLKEESSSRHNNFLRDEEFYASNRASRDKGE